MKKYIIIGLLILLIGSMVIVPMLKGRNSVEEVEAATFAFSENLATKWDQAIALEINVNSDDIVKLELIYNDSLYKTWKNPKGKIMLPFNAGFYGLGARSISLVSTMSNGDVLSDDRVVRVLSDVIPEVWIAKVANSYPHNTGSFTEGLEFHQGQLYESTGLQGQSMIAQTDLNSGAISTTKIIRLDENYFGEGITFFGDNIYQLTYKEQKCFVYNKNTFQMEKEIPYIGEGWGLCNDGKSIIMSNGTERITFRNPNTFAIERTVEVYDHKGPFVEINELEYIDGKIYANVWKSNQVLVIEPLNGKVLATIDCNEIATTGRGLGEVMNGIAQNNGKIYMTGKNWEKLMEVTITKPSKE